MRNLRIIKYMVKAYLNQAGIESRRPVGHTRLGLIGLLLLSMLVFTSTPVSASEAPAKLYETAPFAFSKINPSIGASGQATSLTLDWEDSRFTDNFEYCIDSNVEAGHISACDTTWISTGIVSYKDISGLSSNTTYEWQVRATNELGTTYANTGTWWQFTTIAAPPGVFGKISPAMDATSQATSSLTFSWSASSGATSYEYCYDTTLDNDCESPGVWITNGTATSVVINGLSNSSQYEWQVRAVNSNPTITYADSSTWWHFTTIVAQPGSFGKSSPTSGATGQPINPSLSWEASSDATSYEYCYDSDLTDGHVGVCDTSWTSTELLYANLSGLTYEDVYEWQVRAVNANPTNTYANSGTWWTFTTKANPVGLYKITPGNTATNQPTTLTLEWSSYSGATSYEYCVDPTSTGTLGTCDTGWTNNLLVTFKEISLNYATEYEWQVRANDSFYTYADGISWWTFTTVVAPPGSFNKTSPTNGLLNQELSLTLSWGPSTGATSYRYCIDESNNNTCNTVWNSTDTTSVDISGFNYDTQYYWQVRAYNDNPNYTNANSGSWYNFTTVVAPPGSFYKISPTDGAVNRPINSLTLDWGTSSGADEYEYCIDTTVDLECTSPAVWTSTDANTQVTLNGLSYATEYEWQVRALNTNEIWTDADNDVSWTFTTVEGAPGAFNKISPAHTANNLLPSSVTLQWGASDRAASYWYCVDSTLNANCDGSWVFNDINTTAVPTELQFNTTYEWQIRADNTNPTKTYADGNTWWRFTTRVGTLPGPYTKLFPLDTSIDQATNPTLQWSTATLATRYEYCYVLVAGTCSTWIDNGLSTQVTLSGLALSTPYKWQVRAWNDTVGPTYSNSSNYWTFTTVSVDPPGTFGKVSPANGSTGLPLSLSLTWEPSANVNIYEYCIDNHPTGSCDADWVALPSTATSVDISNLTFGTQYEWQVRAYRDFNPNPTLANGGTWWTFTTTIAQPGGFNKSEPVNQAVDRPTSLSLSWGTSSGVDFYEYCYEVYDGNDTCAGTWFVTATNSADISGLSFATTYSWQVRAVNANPTRTYANGGTWYQFTTIIAPPAGFNKNSPGNGATAQPLTMSLSWNPSSGATSYAYCYDNVVDTSCTGSWIATTATGATLSGLAYSTTYQWQVRATNLSGTVYANSGTQWTFTTLATPPGSFNKTNPAKGLSGVSTSLTLTWGTSSGATSYEYCIDTTLDSACDGDAWISTAGLTSANPAGLAYLTSYQWQVRAVNSNPNPTYANSGTWWIFTTVISPPGPFSKSNPAHNVFNQPSSQYLTWEASSGATSYVYCFDTNLNADCDETWKSTNLLYANEPGLTFGATYEWQVQAVNVNGTTDANDGGTPEWWTFTVKALPAFSKTNPNHLAINQPIDLSITWTAASDLTDQGYYYCLDDINPADDICDTSWVQVSKDTTEVPMSLDSSTTYAFQVIAKTSSGDLYANEGETPEWWTFTTVEISPGTFAKSTPSTGATIQPTNNLTLSWTASSNADGYRYCLDTNTANTTCDTSWTTVGAGTTSIIISNLSYSTTYQWQVMASNNNPVMAEANDGESPEWWTFTTAMAPPEAFNKISPETNAFNQPLNLALSWEPAIGTITYKYCIDSDLSIGHLGVCDTSWITTGMNTSIEPGGLSFDTVYEWQVRAFSDNPHEPTGANGGTWFVLRTVVAPPGIFNKDNPVSGLSDQPVDLMISWEPSPRATGYEYCIDSNLVTPGCNGVWVATTSTQAIVTGLTNQTEYEWHVRAVNANPAITESNSGEWYTFSTIPLYTFVPTIFTPRLTAPVVNPVTVGPPYTNTYSLTWNAVLKANKYKIWESLSTTFPENPTYETTSTSYTLPANKNPTRYYYYVVAYQDLQSSLPSNTVTVTRQYELEENNNSSTANGPIFSGFTYYGQKHDLRDYYKIYMSGPGTITVTLNIPTTWKMQLQLFEGDTGHLRAADVTPNNGMSVTWTGGTANWYYILIATDSTDWTYDWYNFIVTITPTP